MNIWKIKLLIISALLASSATAYAGSADDVASTIPGCDSSIKNIIRSYAEPKLAYEVAVIDEMLGKPYSVLKMVCFKDSLKKTADSSSQIFSGDFFSNIEEYIDNSLDAHYANYDDFLDGREVGNRCDMIGKVVRFLDSSLIKPVPSFSQALDDDFGSTGDKFKDSWDAAVDAGVVTTYDDAWVELTNSYIADSLIFDETDAPCQVLQKAGLTGASCSTAELEHSNQSGSSSTTGTATTVSSADRVRQPTGVRDSVQSAMIYDQELRRAYDYSTEVAAVHKPSSSAALSCFAAAAEVTAKNSAELFSGDYSNQVVDPINEGLESIKEAFSFDNMVDYSASISASAGINLTATVDFGVGNDDGPTVKGLECGQMQGKWLQVRDQAAKTYPSYKEKLAGSSDGDAGFNDAWDNSSSDLNQRMSEREHLTGRDTTRELLFEGPDIPFNDREDFCKILGKMGIAGDCDQDEMNKSSN